MTEEQAGVGCRSEPGRPAQPPGRRTHRLPPALYFPMFVRLWAGSIVSNVGTQMSNVAKLWVLYVLTHSALALGVEGLCFSVPIMVLPLLAGPVCDRVDRRTIVKITTAAEAAEAGALAAIYAAGALHPWVIYLTAGIRGGPAGLRHSRAHRPVLSPGARRVRLGGITRDAAPTGLTSGLRFAWRHRGLLHLEVILLAASTLILGTETLLPVMDQTLWHGGAADYGLLRMAPGIAAVLMGGALAVARTVRSPGRVITLSMLGACGGLIAFTQAPDLAVAFALLGLASLAITSAQVHLVTRIQQVTPDHLRGAISGLSAIAQSGLAGVAAACMALTAASFGARTIIIAVADGAALVSLRSGRRASERQSHPAS